MFCGKPWTSLLSSLSFSGLRELLLLLLLTPLTAPDVEVRKVKSWSGKDPN